jgi:hypothetical protein
MARAPCMSTALGRCQLQGAERALRTATRSSRAAVGVGTLAQKPARHASLVEVYRVYCPTSATREYHQGWET